MSEEGPRLGRVRCIRGILEQQYQEVDVRSRPRVERGTCPSSRPWFRRRPLSSRSPPSTTIWAADCPGEDPPCKQANVEVQGDGFVCGDKHRAQPEPRTRAPRHKRARIRTRPSRGPRPRNPLANESLKDFTSTSTVSRNANTNTASPDNCSSGVTIAGANIGTEAKQSPDDEQDGALDSGVPHHQDAHREVHRNHAPAQHVLGRDQRHLKSDQFIIGTGAPKGNQRTGKANLYCDVVLLGVKPKFVSNQ